MDINEEDLNMVFKIPDNLEYEVDKDGIVTVLEKQDHKIQKFLESSDSKSHSIKRLPWMNLEAMCFYR